MELSVLRTKLAKMALDMGAIRLSPLKPFKWASGYYMPIYNDNRTFLASPEARTMIAKAFALMLKEESFEPANIAGTSTAGIPHATTLADYLSKSLSYVRSSGKDHGLCNQIEGLGREDSYNGKQVLLIEDLISTGGSSVKAVEAIRSANGLVPYCFAIFTYGLKPAEEAFAKLSCKVKTILDYDFVISQAEESSYITKQDAELLRLWNQAPFEWGGNHGFPKEEK